MSFTSFSPGQHHGDGAAAAAAAVPEPRAGHGGRVLAAAAATATAAAAGAGGQQPGVRGPGRGLRLVRHPQLQPRAEGGGVRVREVSRPLLSPV